MSRRRVKEMLRNEFKNSKHKVEAHLDENEDDIPLSSLIIKQAKNNKNEISEQLIPAFIKEETKKEETKKEETKKEETKKEDLEDLPEEKPRDLIKKDDKQFRNAVDLVNEKPLSQQDYEKKIREIEQPENNHSDSEHSQSSNSDHSDSESSSESESDSESSSSESEDDYRRDRRRDDRRRDEDDYRRDDRRRDDRRRDDRRRDDRRRDEDDYERYYDERTRRDDRRRDELVKDYDNKRVQEDNKKREEEKRREEERVKEERRRDEEKKKEERRRDEERQTKKSSKAYSEDAVPRNTYRNRYEGSDDEDRKRSRPRHVRERSVERRPIINNYFKNIPEKVLMKLLKNQDVNRVSSGIYDAIIDVMYKFTEAIILELAEEVKIITSNHIELMMEFYIEDEDKELPKENLIDIKDFENVIVKIVSEKQIGIKKNALYSLQLFIECIMGKILKGAKIVSAACKRARTGGEDVYTAFEIYML
jgi:hypothetical protein